MGKMYSNQEQFLLDKAYELISELEKQGKLTCILPCSMCKHDDKCTGTFEWVYLDALKHLVEANRSEG